jgi:hypothetical protein
VHEKLLACAKLKMKALNDLIIDRLGRKARAVAESRDLSLEVPLSGPLRRACEEISKTSTQGGHPVEENLRKGCSYSQLVYGPCIAIVASLSGSLNEIHAVA